MEVEYNFPCIPHVLCYNNIATFWATANLNFLQIKSSLENERKKTFEINNLSIKFSTEKRNKKKEIIITNGGGND